MLRIYFLSIFAIMIFTQNSFAISEINYQVTYQEKILPLLTEMKESRFMGSGNISIHYRHYLQNGAKNCLIILPGRSEPLEKYAEVVYDLMQSSSGKNLNFFLMDHRGQGSSGRMKTPVDMGYIDSFSNYTKDLESFLRLMDLNNKCEQRFLLAHSMGAGIAVDFLLKYPHYFDKVAFSSPMLKIQTKPYAYPVARAIVDASIAIGRSAKFAVGQKAFNPDDKFESNTFTTSPERFKMAMETFEAYPLTKLGGVSNKWIHEVMKATNKMRSRYHEITSPLRVYHAGIETYSVPDEMIKLCNEAINCKRMFLKSSKHEVLMDRDINRTAVLNSLIEFFN